MAMQHSIPRRHTLPTLTFADIAVSEGGTYVGYHSRKGDGHFDSEAAHHQAGAN